MPQKVMLSRQWQEDLTLVALSQLRKVLTFRTGITGGEGRGLPAGPRLDDCPKTVWKWLHLRSSVSTNEIVSIESRCWNEWR